MELTHKQLIHLPVVTKSGQSLGKVVRFSVDTESQHVAKYFVKSSVLIPDLFDNELIVYYRQVLSLTEKEMVVEDAVIKKQVPQKVQFPFVGQKLETKNAAFSKEE